MPCGSAARMAAAKDLDTVTALPFRLSEKGAIMGVTGPLKPSEQAIGIGPSMWAPSNRPTETLSRILAQDASRDSVTSSPSAAKKPFSLAAITVPASLSGMKPRRRSVRSSLVIVRPL